MQGERAKIERYQVYPGAEFRPKRRGGNRNPSMCSHALWINGERYSFRAVGRKQWIFKSALLIVVTDLDTIC
jgi:hypothetical protein